MMAKQKTSRSERWFRRLVKLFPFDFRWEHGREMEQDFRTRSREEERHGGGNMGMLKLWWETITDILTTAPREHLDMLRQDVSYALRVRPAGNPPRLAFDGNSSRLLSQPRSLMV